MNEFVEEVKRMMKLKGFRRAIFKNCGCQTISFTIPEKASANLVLFHDGAFEFKYAHPGFAMGVVAVSKEQTLEFINGI